MMKTIKAKWVVACLLLASAASLLAQEPQPSSPERDTFYIVPHTHWEGAVFFTREEYTRDGMPRILQAINLLKKYPNYRFTLDQLCCIKPFLETHPEEEEAVRRFIKEGRLAIVGGMVVMPDDNMPSGESFIRQILCSKGYFRQKLGLEVTTAWFLDSFGHHPQIPQLLSLAGYKWFWFSRGIWREDKTPAEFHWEGVDGSRIATIWLPYGYTNVWGAPSKLPEFGKHFKRCFNELTPWANGPGRVGMDGNDDAKPGENVPRLIDGFNSMPDRPFNLQMSLPADYEAAVAARKNRPTIKGDFNPVFPGGYSSRIELKQQMRELERLLTTAEKLGAMLNILGRPGGDGDLWSAWEPMLFNQTHDLASGVMSDKVYRDTVATNGKSQRIAEEAVSARLKALADGIDTQGDGQAVVVWNTLGWPRSDVVSAKVEFAPGIALALAVKSPDGKVVPAQILSSRRGADGSVLSAEVAFRAVDVPAMGYSVYNVVPLAVARDGAAKTAVPRSEPTLENAFYKLKVDPAGGAISELMVKAGEWNALAGPGNVVAKEEDRGDLWELYQSLFKPLPDKVRYALPRKDKTIFSNTQGAALGTVRVGAVFSEFEVVHPFGGQGVFRTRVRLYEGQRRIDIRTTILNQEKFVRYRALFPTSLRQGESIHEIPFAAINRPTLKELPAQNWVDFSNGVKGVALLNRGLPGNNVVDGTLMLSLGRCVNLHSYNQGQSSDTGFELGKELTLDYALVPHAGGWQEARVYRDGLEFNNPLLVHVADAHAGSLPKQWGLLSVSHPGVVISALKSAEDGKGVVVRLYEANGAAAEGVKLAFLPPIVSAEEVNLMEDSLRNLVVRDNSIAVNLRPFEIKTIRVKSIAR